MINELRHRVRLHILSEDLRAREISRELKTSFSCVACVSFWLAWLTSAMSILLWAQFRDSAETGVPAHARSRYVRCGHRPSLYLISLPGGVSELCEFCNVVASQRASYMSAHV